MCQMHGTKGGVGGGEAEWVNAGCMRSAEGPTALYAEGVFDRECPFTLDAGGNGAALTRVCVERPSQQRTLTLPDASGTVRASILLAQPLRAAPWPRRARRCMKAWGVGHEATFLLV